MRRRRGQGQTEYIILVGLIALVLVAAVRHFAFRLDEAIEGTALAVTRLDPADFLRDEDGNLKSEPGVPAGFDKANGYREVFAVPVEDSQGVRWVKRYGKTAGSAPLAANADVVNSKP